MNENVSPSPSEKSVVLYYFDQITHTHAGVYLATLILIMPPGGVGDDPHFATFLSSGKLLCYTMQGEHNILFNLISNDKIHI